MRNHFGVSVPLVLILGSVAGSGAGAVPGWKDTEPTVAKGEHFIMRPPGSQVDWSAADLAFREAMNADSSFTSSAVAVFPRDAAVNAWRRFLQRTDLSKEQRAFAWWRIGSLLAYNFDPRRGESADYVQAEQAFAQARELLSDIVCAESLNAATVYAGLPGTPMDRARRISTAFNWIATRTDEDLERSSYQINQSGYVIDAKFFPNIARRESSVSERKQMLRQQLLEYRHFIAEKVTEAIRYGKDRKAAGDMLESLKGSADPKEMEKWRAMYRDLNARVGGVPAARRSAVRILLGVFAVGSVVMGYFSWRRL